MLVSVLIPTHARPEKLAACVRGLAAQTLDPAAFEVLVGPDGEDASAEQAGRAAHDAWRDAGGREGGLRILPGARAGQAAVRNRLLPHARGEVLVFLNDDMRPEPTLLETHLAAQRQARARGGAPGGGPDGEPHGALIAGDAPWVVHHPDRLFDRLVRETSMIFFHDRMRPHAADRERDWGFRHAWLLNLSAPARLLREEAARRAGLAFSVFPCAYGYEDDELAFRLRQRYGTRVLFRPEAVALHDHRYEPADYLAREESLGYAAWGFARATPECALAMFGRDITGDDEIAYSREFVAREARTVERLEPAFLALAEIPADAVAGPHAPRLVETIYGQHLLIKRWHWRRGLLRAADAHPRTP